MGILGDFSSCPPPENAIIVLYTTIKSETFIRLKSKHCSLTGMNLFQNNYKTNYI